MTPSRKPGRRSVRRTLALFLVGGGALASVACGAARPFGGPVTMVTSIAATSARAETPERFEAALLARVNADRAAHGLRAVEFDPELLPAARARAAARAPGEGLTHEERAGKSAGELAFQRLLKEAGVRYSAAGENLARPRVAADSDAVRVAEAAERALMASAAHRQNILDPAFDRVAVGM